MAELTVPRVDFSSLGELPDVYRNARTQATREMTLANLGRDGNVNYEAAAASLFQNGDFDGGLKLAQLGKVLRGDNSYYGTPIYGTRQDGSTAVGTFDKRGQFKEIQTPGFTPTPGVKMLNTGTGFVPVQTKTGQPVAGAAFQPGAGQKPSGPTGYIPKDVRGEAYQKKEGAESAERDAALPEKKNKAEAALSDLKRQWSVVDTDIDRAIKSIDAGWMPRAGLGSSLAAIPGTPQNDLQNLLNTIKANIGFDKLQSMRMNSPTGGALGNVSDNENKLLQAVQGALEQTQSDKQLKYNLTRIKQLMTAVKDERENAFQRDFGNVTITPRANTGAAANPRARPNANETRAIGGKNYIKVGDQWFEQ
jgi:hypothetical protein